MVPCALSDFSLIKRTHAMIYIRDCGGPSYIVFDDEEEVRMRSPWTLLMEKVINWSPCSPPLIFRLTRAPALSPSTSA